MKKLLLVLVVAFLSSCTVVRYPFVKRASSFDFRKHTDQGFYLAESDVVSFPYIQVASVSAIFTSGYEPLKKNGQNVMVENIDGSMQPKLSKKLVIADLQETLDMIVAEAKAKGANGIINLKFKPSYDITKVGSLYTGYEISGWAIKK